jgi:hypothetical protein
MLYLSNVQLYVVYRYLVQLRCNFSRKIHTTVVHHGDTLQQSLASIKGKTKDAGAYIETSIPIHTLRPGVFYRSLQCSPRTTWSRILGSPVGSTGRHVALQTGNAIDSTLPRDCPIFLFSHLVSYMSVSSRLEKKRLFRLHAGQSACVRPWTFLIQLLRVGKSRPSGPSAVTPLTLHHINYMPSFIPPI